ncbi:uncharacterized protein LOC116336748 [Contarinia nasturtii]|uniref:uncharacterized protein LOC116336748 n=1 Tax=Contarinia nasturtii TaxID=265458 RepID=UPI0012D3EAD3|nr:uncharacterized protein LOC116336748 [Contarinia nasturtii]
MSRIIHIIDFIDPHCFYFKFDDDLHDTKLQNLEDEIANYARTKLKETTQFNAVEGDTVAAYQISWAKWIRAKVLENFEDLKRCKLWAIDHGQIFETAHKNILPLPQNFSDKTVNGVFRGCIYGMSPANLVFNYDNFVSELKICQNWSQKAINQCKMIINNKNVFEIKYDIKVERDNYFFGNLSVTTLLTDNDGSKEMYDSDFKEALISITEAISVDFEKEMDRIVMKYGALYNGQNTSQKKNHFETVPVRSDHNPNSEPITVHNESSTIVLSEIDQGITRLHLSKHSAKPAPSTIVPSEIDQGITRMGLGKKFANPVASTILSSEIDQDFSRMDFGRIPNPAASILSTVVPSEIDGGVTRLQMNSILNTHKIDGKIAHMPAGFEREIPNFKKYNNHS